VLLIVLARNEIIRSTEAKTIFLPARPLWSSETRIKIPGVVSILNFTFMQIIQEFMLFVLFKNINMFYIQTFTIFVFKLNCKKQII
jgi:hypothetical protein